MGPKALYQTTRAAYKTESDSIKIKDLIRLFTEYYLPKRNTHYNHGVFLGETNGSGIIRRILEKTNENRKRMHHQHNLSRRTFDIQIFDRNQRQDTANKLMKEKTKELKKTSELNKQYEKKNKKHTIPGALISSKKKHVMKEEPIQRMERFGA